MLFASEVGYRFDKSVSVLIKIDFCIYMQCLGVSELTSTLKWRRYQEQQWHNVSN